MFFAIFSLLVFLLFYRTTSRVQVPCESPRMLLASGSNDFTVKIWNIDKDSECVMTLVGHNEYVRRVLFSQDMKTLYSSSYDRTVKVWDVSTGTLIKTFSDGHTQWIFGLSLSPKEDLLATGSYSDKKIIVRNTNDGSKIKEFDTASPVSCLKFSPDGKYLFAGMENGSVKVYEVATWAQKDDILAHSEVINNLAVSEDGQFLSTGSNDKSAKIFDSKNNFNCIQTINHDKASGSVYGLAFSPDGSVLASGAYQTIFLTSVKNGQKQTLPHSDPTYSLAFSNDGKHLFSANKDVLVIWDASSGALLSKLPNLHNRDINDIDVGTKCVNCVSSDCPTCSICGCQNNFQTLTEIKNCAALNLDRCSNCPDEKTNCNKANLCDSSKFLSRSGTTCVSTCSDLQVANSLNKACEICNERCKVCLGSGSNCQSCMSGYFLKGSTCLNSQECTLAKGWVADSTCANCHSSCETCSGSDSNNCLTCPKTGTPFKISSNECLAVCSEGYYGDSQKICQICNTRCKSCDGPDYTNCQSCKLNFYLKGLSCLNREECFSARGWLSNNLCLDCDPSCLTCSGSSSKECLTCPSSTTSFKTLENQCVATCPQSFYADDSKICQPCNERCLRCLDPGFKNCQSCKTGYFLKNSCCFSNSECIDDFGWPDQIQKLCLNCHSTCLTCSGPEKTNCLSCPKLLNPYLHANQCLDKCPEGFFIYLKDFKCYQICPSSLYGQTLTRTCEENCAKNEYGDNSDRICKACDSSCSTCSVSSKNCTSCPISLFQNGNSCVEMCPEPLWGNNSTQKCESKCTNTNEFGDALGKRVCLPCKENCATCSDSTHCTSCTLPKFLSDSICVETCPEPNWGNNNTAKCEAKCTNSNEYGDASGKRVCRSCDKKCETCSISATNCLSCAVSFFVFGSSCVEICPEPTWGNNGTKKCEDRCTNSNEFGDASGKRVCKPCNEGCTTCSILGSNCTSCANGKFLSGSECVEICPDPSWGITSTKKCESKCNNPNEFGDKLGKRICKICDKSCATCLESATNCISCAENFFLSRSSCVEVCPEPTWGNIRTKKCEDKCANPNEFGDASGKRICKLCNEACSTCSILGNNCTSCSIEKFLSGSECVEICPDPSWGNNSTKKCESKCTNPNEFGDKLGKRICKPCDKSCAVCIDSATNCQSCSPLFFLSGSACLTSCPIPTWGNNNTKKCVDSCLNSNEFGDISDNRICKACLSNCAKCEIKDACIECNEGYYLKSSTNTNIYDSCISNCPASFSKSIIEGRSSPLCQVCSSSKLDILLPPLRQVCKLCSDVFEGCRECSTTEKCDSCLPSHFFYQSKCFPDCNQKDLQILDLQNAKCISKCDDRYFEKFDAELKQKTCVLCPSECEQCKNEKECSFCRLGYVLTEGTKCGKTCPPGTNPNWIERTCSKCKNSEFPFIEEGKTVCGQCEAPCRSCTGNPKNCTSCLTPKLWNGVDCVGSCELGKYPIHEFGVCGKCHPTCKSCDWESIKNCLECEHPRFLYKGECVEKCPDLYFHDIKARECKVCDITCSKCRGPKRSECLDCAKAREFIPQNNSTVEEYAIGECVCKPRYFENKEQMCEENCKLMRYFS